MDGWIKLDDGNEYPYVEFGGHKRILAAIPSPPGAVPSWRGAPHTETIPQSEWAEFSMAPLGMPILDQDSLGACASFAVTTAFMVAWLMGGRLLKEFDPFFQYAQVNGGRDGGSSPVQNMQSLVETGICLREDNPRSEWVTSRLPRSTYESAKRFRAEEVLELADFDEMVSAVLQGWGVGFGMALPANFTNVDSEGIPPMGGSFGGRHGLHSMAARGVRWSKRYKEWLLEVPNSWTEQFGIDGCCWLRRGHFEDSQYFEAYAIKTARDAPDDPDNPPPILVGEPGGDDGGPPPVLA